MMKTQAHGEDMMKTQAHGEDMMKTQAHGEDMRKTQAHGEDMMPLFQLIPSQRQVVFRGDRLPLQCTASYLDPSVELRWRHNRRMVTTHEDRGIYVEDTLIHDCCLITSEVILSNIELGIGGTWECLVAKDFSWHPCLLALRSCHLWLGPPPSGSAAHPSSQRGKKAWRSCDQSGRWAEEDYTQCPYASELTRVLHKLTQITVNTTNAQPLGQQLVAFTSRAAHFTDVMDVIFVTHLVERLTRLVEKRKDLGDYISDIASNMMLVEEHVLWMAQNEARACTRIVQCVERIADLSLTGDNQVISKVSANIALEAFLIRPSNFLGLSCTAFSAPPPHLPPRPSLAATPTPTRTRSERVTPRGSRCSTSNATPSTTALHQPVSSASLHPLAIHSANVFISVHVSLFVTVHQQENLNVCLSFCLHAFFTSLVFFFSGRQCQVSAVFSAITTLSYSSRLCLEAEVNQLYHMRDNTAV
ncbi:hypothetical protein F7725_024433 [Dissostichus mawsoni]|uniref:Ig-like domain-containing protein n=1 Tax=Dissostichus mawsoni TaxID=36200 RepID=A0A7J5XZF0_DISMA|nr:hypothetical protein F7725_024433 [Dissostichus mawsoni]